MLHKIRLLKSLIQFGFLFFLNSLTKSYLTSDFYLDSSISKVLQSMGYCLGTVGLKAAKVQVSFLIYASLWGSRSFAYFREVTDFGGRI